MASNDELIQGFPLEAETPESILARLLADINAGIDPADPLYGDTLPGSVWDDMNRAVTLEFDRIYDRMLTEVPMAALPITAIGVWLDGWAAVVGLTRKVATNAEGTVTFTGTAGDQVPSGTQISTVAAAPGQDPIVFLTNLAATIPDGETTVDVAVTALNAGSAGNVPANTVTLLQSEVAGVTVANAQPMTSGSDVETDEALQLRVWKKMTAPPGAGNADYYANIALNYSGVGYVTVLPNDPSKGFVVVVVTDVNNNSVSSSIISGLQAQLDPGAEPGDGFGDATIGATVTVTTPALLDVVVAGTGHYEPGYSAWGVGGTIALQPAVLAAVQNYINNKPAAGTIVFNKVLAAIVDVTGMANISGLTVNGLSNEDITLTSGQVATVTAVNLT